MTQKAPVLIPIILVIVVALVGSFFLLTKNETGQQKPQIKSKSTLPIINSTPSVQNLDEPPLKLKSIGINFEDFKFTKAKLQFGRLFMFYGFYILGGSDNPAKYNPQPTFVVPLGTPVRSLVDGVVAGVPKVWSGDYSIQVTVDGKMQKWVYETEHVINPKVKAGDKVSAGQIVGEVSTFDKGAPAGFGTVEIGILKGGNPPYHVCPFAHLDESIKEEVFKKMKDLFKSWEDYIGDKSLYDESLPVLGCLTLDPIAG